MSSLFLNEDDIPCLEMGRGAGRNIEKLQLLPLKGYKRYDYSNESWARALEGRSGDPLLTPSLPLTSCVILSKSISYFGDLSLLLVNKDMGQAGLRVTLLLSSGLLLSMGFQLQLTILD